MTSGTPRPYRVEFPDSTERARTCRTLEDAITEAEYRLYSVWRDTTKFGDIGEHIHPDVDRAVITNRETGYRWILRRRDRRVEFQTPAIFERVVGDEMIDLRWDIAEAEAVARAACAGAPKDKRERALVYQALDQLAFLASQVRERVRGADEFFEWARGISPRPPTEPDEETTSTAEADAEEDQEDAPPRPLPEYVSLKGAARILGRAPSTLYKWHREGKFPPAVDIAQYDRLATTKNVVVPLDRLEAWRNGERMRPVLREVFDVHGLHEPPYLCLTVRKGARRDDVAYWIDKRGLTPGLTIHGKRIYGAGLEEHRRYEPYDRTDNS